MDASVASPVHTTKGDAHYKGYTTALPNTGIYDMKISTNKCTSGMVQGRPKTMYKCTRSIFPAKNGREYAISLYESKGATENNVLVYTPYCFPAKKGGEKQKSAKEA